MEFDKDRSLTSKEIHERYVRASSVGRVPTRRASPALWSTRSGKQVLCAAIISTAVVIPVFSQPGTDVAERDQAAANTRQFAGPVAQQLDLSSAIARIPAHRPLPMNQTHKLDATEAAAGNDYLVVVFSTSTEWQALKHANSLIGYDDALQVVQSNTGLYAVAMGSFDAKQALRVKRQAIRDQVAADAYLMHRKRVVHWLQGEPREAISAREQHEILLSSTGY